MTAEDLAAKRCIEAIVATAMLVADDSEDVALALLIASIVTICQEAQDPADSVKLLMQALSALGDLVVATTDEESFS